MKLEEIRKMLQDEETTRIAVLLDELLGHVIAHDTRLACLERAHAEADRDAAAAAERECEGDHGPH